MSSKKYEILKVKDKSDKNIRMKNLIFDLPFRVLINASSGQGKTNLILNLLGRPEFYGEDFEGENIYIVSGSLLNDLKIHALVKLKKIPVENLYTKFNEEALRDLYQDLKEDFQERMEDNKPIENVCILLDDIAFSGKMKEKANKGILSELLCNSRKIGINILLTSQRYSQVSTVIRSNLTGVIAYNMSNRELDLFSDDWDFTSSRKNFIKEFREASRKRFSFFVCNKSNDRDKWYLKDNFNTTIQM